MQPGMYLSPVDLSSRTLHPFTQISVSSALSDSTTAVTDYSYHIGGSLHKQEFSIGGSGSTYIYGYCDSNFRENVSKGEWDSLFVQSQAMSVAVDDRPKKMCSI